MRETISTCVQALRGYIFTRRFRALRGKLAPYVQAQGIHTDEDVFRALRDSADGGKTHA